MKYVRINKLVTGYYAYNKLTFPVGTIFEFEYETEKEIRFHEVGRPNVAFTLSKSLFAENTFEVVDFLADADLQRVASDLKHKLEEKARLEEYSRRNSEFLNRMLDELPRYQYTQKR